MRIKRAVSAVKKRRKIMKQAKGYYGGKSRLYRVAKQQVMRSGAISESCGSRVSTRRRVSTT